METALQRMAGPMLAGWLNRATSAPWKGMAFSAGATALLQSSTAVTVLTIGLANARLITYGRTLGIILGTNIGTCLTTELVGLQIGRAALPLLLLSLTGWAVLLSLVNAIKLPMNALAVLWPICNSVSLRQQDLLLL